MPVRSVGVHRLSAIPRTLVDRSNPPPESDDDEGEECIEYDVYGWFKLKFESDADAVFAASTVSGSRCMIWSRQTAGRQQFSSYTRSWAAVWLLREHQNARQRHRVSFRHQGFVVRSNHRGTG